MPQKTKVDCCVTRGNYYTTSRSRIIKDPINHLSIVDASFIVISKISHTIVITNELTRKKQNSLSITIIVLEKNVIPLQPPFAWVKRPFTKGKETSGPLSAPCYIIFAV